MGLNNINSKSTWGQAASDINTNFTTIDSDLKKVKNATTRNKGYFSTSSELISAFPTASKGDIAYVGSSYPYDIWKWNGSSWANSGSTGGEESVNLGNYHTAGYVDEKLSELGSTVSANKEEADAKLSELGSEVSDLDDSLYLIGRKLYGDVSKSYSFTTGDSYAETLFESPLRKGDTIKSISFSTAVVAYFIKKDGTITNAIDVSSYPKELTEEYIGIKTSSKTNVLILVNYDTVGALEKVKTSEDKIETLETDYSELNFIVNGKGIEVIEVKAEGSYNEFLFPMPIIEQSIIKSISLPNTINAYLTKNDGTYDVNTPVNSLSFPYVVNDIYRGIKVAKESTFNIVVDYNRIGLKEYTDNQVAKIEKDIIGTNILYNTEKGFINTTGYDTEVVFDKIIPVGSIITKVNNSVGVIWWLTNSNGSASLNLSELQLPYTTTSEYRGIRASSSGNYRIEYTEGAKTEGKVRQTIKVLTSDSDVQVFGKMLSAYRQGSVDVFFEKGIYELKEVYTTIRDVLNTTWTVGLPIGNDCRYYFNGATLISNQPSDGFNQSRNILDCQAEGSNYELHDATLINNGGRYCVHDEGNKSNIPYIHKYNNIKMIYNTTDATPDSGCKPYGAGLGYNSELSFCACQFIHNGDEGTPFAVHGVVGAAKQQVFKLTMQNCYINKNNLYVNEISKDKDIIEYYLVGNLWGSDFVDSNYTKLLKWNNVVV